MGLIDNIEFNAKLRNHYVGKENIYRLGFVWHYRFNHGKSLGSTEWFGKPFMLPQGMSRNEGFKVLSYLTDFIEKEESYEPCSYQSVIALENILDSSSSPEFSRAGFNLYPSCLYPLSLF